MAVNNFDPNQILLELDNEINRAEANIASEIRLAIEAEIIDEVANTIRDSSWQARLRTGLPIHIEVCGNWIFGIIQHACDECLVIVSDDRIYIVATSAVNIIRELPTLISKQTHSSHRCWRAVLVQVHDVKVTSHGKILAGSVGTINRDAFDIYVFDSHLTLPWSQIQMIEIAL